MSQMTTERPPEVPPEIPLPPPATPEREPERSPAHERLSVAVGEASVWVAELRRRAREFARRHDVTPRVSFVLAGGERVVVAAVAAGPGTAFVTVTPAQPSAELTELIVRLDEVARVELAATRADAADRFRGCGRDLGFSMS
jgi:hypothetical protein